MTRGRRLESQHDPPGAGGFPHLTLTLSAPKMGAERGRCTGRRRGAPPYEGAVTH
jgi:hypothetical protein